MKQLYTLCLSCFVFLLSISYTVCVGQSQHQSSASEKNEIAKVMAKQQDGWNQGNLESFMDGYWNSPELTFVGKRGVTKGWNPVLQNYIKAYPTKQEMGSLKFDIVSNDKMAEDTYFMIGKYTLTYPSPKPEASGHFTLVWKKINGEWKIITDHSS